MIDYYYKNKLTGRLYRCSKQYKFGFWFVRVDDQEFFYVKKEDFTLLYTVYNP